MSRVALAPLVGALALAGCASAPVAAPAPLAPETAVARPLTADPPLAVEDGPAVADPAALLAWLEAGGARRVQLPVVLTFAPSRLGVAAAAVGAAPGALPVRLDDAALGVALLDHARRLCPEGPTCAVWLEGRWGARDLAAELGAPPGPAHGFTVLRVLGPADAAATHARGEKR
jgi:hypothetical protein